MSVEQTTEVVVLGPPALTPLAALSVARRIPVDQASQETDITVWVSQLKHHIHLYSLVFSCGHHRCKKPVELKDKCKMREN